MKSKKKSGGGIKASLVDISKCAHGKAHGMAGPIGPISGTTQNPKYKGTGRRKGH